MTTFHILLTLLVCSISSLCLLVFSCLTFSHLFLFQPLPQLSARSISVCLLSCTIMYVQAFYQSSVTLLPVDVTLIPSLLPSCLLFVVKTLDISPVPGGISSYSRISVLKNSLPYFLLFISSDLFLSGPNYSVLNIFSELIFFFFVSHTYLDERETLKKKKNTCMYQVMMMLTLKSH